MPDALPRGATHDIYELMNTQRAIRRFRPDPVPDAVIERLIFAATRAPSGSNLQPWAFVIVKDARKRQVLSDALLAAVESRGGFADLDAIEDPERRRMMRGVNALFRNFASAPVVIIPCLVNATSPAADGLLAGSSIYPSVQNLLLAARAEGLGTLLTTRQQSILDTLRAELAIPERATPVAIIPLGYPAVPFGPVNRKPIAEFVHWDQW
ncbi:MAG: nitroreductase family protein [Dehalococcoidia bacterium]